MLRCSNLNSFFSLFCSLYILLVVVALDMTGSNIEVTVSAIIVRALQNPYSSYRWREGRCNDGWVTVLTCQWLMGTCKVNSVDLPDGTSCNSGVFVERCKYLEESKCVGICINTCKLPTQSFFKDYMGVPLLMEPNFSDYSCQFKFGVSPPLPEDDNTLKESCLDVCPIANKRREIRRNVDAMKCPNA